VGKKSTDGPWRIKLLSDKNLVSRMSLNSQASHTDRTEKNLHKQETKIYVGAARVRYFGNKDIQKDRQCTNHIRVALSSNHCCNGKATMCTVGLHVTVNNIKTLDVPQQYFYGEFMSPATIIHA
jgi:hypothetical protein